MRWRETYWRYAILILASSAGSASAAPHGAAAAVDPASITVPSLAFVETAADVQGYDKYFYFRRDHTTFAEAYADIVECDGYARGLTSFQVAGQPPYGGLSGGEMLLTPVVGFIADAIQGSAKRRTARRANMRVCMGYKGYDRYGLPKQIWEQINFEEGNSPPTEQDRQAKLMQQAKIAAGPKPDKGELK